LVFILLSANISSLNFPLEKTFRRIQDATPAVRLTTLRERSSLTNKAPNFTTWLSFVFPEFLSTHSKSLKAVSVALTSEVQKSMSYRKQLPLLLALVVLAVPFVLTHAAGGKLTGVVTDSKGSVIVGASVTAASPTGEKKFAAATDDEGRYKFANLPAGIYLLTVKAPGFSEARREGVSIGKGATTLDVKLEVAPVEGLVPAGTE
jgi:hypothetical protein